MTVNTKVINKSAREITEATLKANMLNSSEEFTKFVSKEALDDIAETASKRVAKGLVQDDLPKLTYKDLLPSLKPSTRRELDTLAKNLLLYLVEVLF